MRLPLPFLLYMTALALFGWAGWTVYETLPLWKREERDAASKRGIDGGTGLLAKGRGQGPVAADWDYSNAWWQRLNDVNLIGKLPAKKPTPEEIARTKKPETPPVDMTPLEDIIELVSLVCEGRTGGKGGRSHVIVRYKESANVEPPEWWVRENSPPSAGGPGDIAAMPGRTQIAQTPPANRNRGRNRGRGNRNQRPPRPLPTAAPTTMTGRQILQKIWVDGGDDPRRSSRLWPKFSHIRLVRVAADAQRAYFVRELPPPKEGEAAPEPKEEELIKTTMNLSQDVLRELRRLQGREVEAKRNTGDSAAVANQWREVEETTRFGNEFHIGRKDQRSFRAGADDFLNSLYVDTYVSSRSKLRGLQVRGADNKIAQRYGVATGDVLLSINNRPVESKAQAVSRVKRDYKRGVRTFTTQWLSNGQEVTRVYQAPTGN